MTLLEKKEKRDALLRQYDFSLLAENELDPQVKRRLLGMALLQNGKNINDTSKQLNVCRQSVRYWLFRMERMGLEGLSNLPMLGRKPKLKKDDIQRMHEEVQIFIQNFQGKNKRIYAKHIMRFIEKKYSVDYSNSTIYKMLRGLGISILHDKISH